MTQAPPWSRVPVRGRGRPACVSRWCRRRRPPWRGVVSLPDSWPHVQTERMRDLATNLYNWIFEARFGRERAWRLGLHRSNAPPHIFFTVRAQDARAQHCRPSRAFASTRAKAHAKVLAGATWAFASFPVSLFLSVWDLGAEVFRFLPCCLPLHGHPGRSGCRAQDKASPRGAETQRCVCPLPRAPRSSCTCCWLLKPRRHQRPRHARPRALAGHDRRRWSSSWRATTRITRGKNVRASPNAAAFARPCWLETTPRARPYQLFSPAC